MNLKAAAHELGVHYQTAYKWVRSGALTAVRIGGRYEISEAAIQQFEEQVKRNRTFSAGLTEARLDRIGVEAARADQQYTYRTFQLSCTAGRK